MSCGACRTEAEPHLSFRQVRRCPALSWDIQGLASESHLGAGHLFLPSSRENVLRKLPSSSAPCPVHLLQKDVKLAWHDLLFKGRFLALGSPEDTSAALRCAFLQCGLWDPQQARRSLRTRGFPHPILDSEGGVQGDLRICRL